jgi:L-alanine-DL-glutamate epimerase-like enolase superfamily enzyme
MARLKSAMQFFIGRNLSQIDSLMNELDQAMAEQPVPAKDWAGMAAVAAAVKPPILADQSINSVEDGYPVARRKAAGALSIKLLKLGGIRRVVVEACQLVGLACHVGDLVEGLEVIDDAIRRPMDRGSV